MSDVQSTGVIDKFRYAKWLLGQADKLQAMVGYAQAFRDAETPRQKWVEGVNPAVLIGFDLYESFPTAAALEVVTLADVEVAATALGVDADTFRLLIEVFLPLVLEFIQKLRG